MAQAIVTAGVLFFVYRFVVREAGLRDLGVWALVAGAATTSSIGNLGLGASVVKYVAKALSTGNERRAAEVMETGFLVVALFVGLLGVLGYVLLPGALEFLIADPGEVRLANQLLGWALLAFWLISLGGIVQGGLDGRNRLDLRVVVNLTGVLVYVVAVIALVPRVGILGLVYAQITQGIATILAGWGTLRTVSKHLNWIPLRFRISTLRDMLGYGVNFQVISIAQIFIEPTAKGVMTMLSGSAETALLEMANKLVFQVRNLVTAAYQAVFPAVADLHESAPAEIPKLYHRSLRVVVVAALLLLVATIAALPAISIAWLGEVDARFLGIGTVLAVAWYSNLISSPAFVNNAGTGQITWNVVGFVLMAVSVPGLGVLLGRLMGPLGVALGFGGALILGGLVIVVEYHHRTHTSWAGLFAREDRLLASICAALAVSAITISGRMAVGLGFLGYSLVAGLVLAITVLPALLSHPQVRWLSAQVGVANKPEGRLGG